MASRMSVRLIVAMVVVVALFLGSAAVMAMTVSDVNEVASVPRIRTPLPVAEAVVAPVAFADQAPHSTDVSETPSADAAPPTTITKPAPSASRPSKNGVAAAESGASSISDEEREVIKPEPREEDEEDHPETEEHDSDSRDDLEDDREDEKEDDGN